MYHNILYIVRVGQLAWLVHMIGHVMGVRISHTNSSEYDTMDGQLVCRLVHLMGTHRLGDHSLVVFHFLFDRVLQLMDLSDIQLPQVMCLL